MEEKLDAKNVQLASVTKGIVDEGIGGGKREGGVFRIYSEDEMTRAVEVLEADTQGQ